MQACHQWCLTVGKKIVKLDSREDHCLLFVVDNVGDCSYKALSFITALVGWGWYNLTMHAIDYQKVLLNNQAFARMLTTPPRTLGSHVSPAWTLLVQYHASSRHQRYSPWHSFLLQNEPHHLTLGWGTLFHWMTTNTNHQRVPSPLYLCTLCPFLSHTIPSVAQTIFHLHIRMLKCKVKRQAMSKQRIPHDILEPSIWAWSFNLNSACHIIYMSRST